MLQVQELRKRTAQLPDDYLVTFVGEQPAAASMRWIVSAPVFSDQHDWRGLHVSATQLDKMDAAACAQLSHQVAALLLADLRLKRCNVMAAVTGDMITEEALPTYMAMLNTLDGVRDETGASPTPWGQWTRQWTAEENRHGDVMNKYMYLTGRWVVGDHVLIGT